MSRVVITFKDNEKERKIKEFLDQKVSASAYIKEVIWEIINNNTDDTNTTSETTQNKETDGFGENFNFKF